jgi:hypothetical protein
MRRSMAPPILAAAFVGLRVLALRRTGWIQFGKPQGLQHLGELAHAALVLLSLLAVDYEAGTPACIPAASRTLVRGATAFSRAVILTGHSCHSPCLASSM